MGKTGCYNGNSSKTSMLTEATIVFEENDAQNLIMQSEPSTLILKGLNDELVKLQNIAEPVEGSDAVNKAYLIDTVDANAIVKKTEKDATVLESIRDVPSNKLLHVFLNSDTQELSIDTSNTTFKI